VWCSVVFDVGIGAVEMYSVEVNLIWVQPKSMWVMETLDGSMIQEFFNCDKMQTYFEGLDKKKPQTYQICITRR